MLNLPSAASDTEIRERYRQLSIIFHPDKHHGKDTEETATKRFLEVQKAYESMYIAIHSGGPVTHAD